MKKLFLLCVTILAFLLTFEANAQELEILRLKDGTEITGTIEQLPDGGVRIMDLNGDIFIFSADEISTITNAHEKAKIAKKERRKSNSGYTGIIQTSIGYPLDGGIHFSAGIINCYKFNPWLFSGIGIDIGTTTNGFYTLDQKGQCFILPIYLHIRYSILGGYNYNLSPYLAFNIGSDIIHGGISFGPSVGIQIKNLKKGNLWIGVDFPIRFAADISFIDFCFKAGWSF